MRIKKGRSEIVSDLPGPERTPEVDDLMRLDDEEEGAEDDQVRVEVEEEEGEKVEEKESDQELYMVTDDGRKKKLVKIRLESSESAESHKEILLLHFTGPNEIQSGASKANLDP
ncbi:hypothetical protein PGT21_027028 [Puccinia graminis f. sp. tritici]|uniref:Uncharacterized protein n=1 Tax=Puccinia graminis f. sp. tritici TaxID=56615 RepID=A0A5B0N1U1_PUCGR|nr:hypothetical protein PGT21_027028 [Puccinia graminis f. sp. tritici]